jgi:spore germination protein YaaH
VRSPILLTAVALLAFAVPAHAYRMSAWVPSWDANAVTIMQMQAGNLTETNPGWYSLAADGSIAKNYKAEDPTLRAALSGTQLVPTIKNLVNGSFDGALVAAIVADPLRRESHAEALAQLAVTQNFAGIDIDYESVPASAKSDFSAFVQLLAAKLHASQRLLSVTVHAKTSDSATWDGPGAQDWRAIGAAADSVKIMAYDKHWSTSAAGAIAPLDWLDQIATYAETTIPAGRAILGLPWYGYDWLASQGTAVTYASATATAERVGATVTHDVNGEATFTYDGRTVFFQDASSYRAKVNRITSAHPGIGGFAHWRVGAEDPATWAIVRELTMQAPSIRPAPQDFRVDAPLELSVMPGREGSMRVRYVAIDGFDASVAVSVTKVDAFGGLALLSTPTITKTTAATLVVSVPTTTHAGDYRLEITMSGGGLTRKQTVTVHVTPPPRKRRAA